MDAPLETGRLSRLVDELVRPLGGRADQAARDDFTAYANKAWELVSHHLGTSDVPEAIVDEAVIACAIELQTRRKSPSGIYSAFGEDTSPAYLARDPLSTAKAILRPYLEGGFA